MALLEENGWVAGADGVREKDGQRLTVRHSQIVGVPVSENEAQLVQSQLAEVGIEVEIVDIAAAGVQQRARRRRVRDDGVLVDRHAVPVLRASSRSTATARTATSRYSNIPEIDPMIDRAGDDGRRGRAGGDRQRDRRDPVGVRPHDPAVPASRAGRTNAVRSRQLRRVRLHRRRSSGPTSATCELTLTRNH